MDQEVTVPDSDDQSLAITDENRSILEQYGLDPDTQPVIPAERTLEYSSSDQFRLWVSRIDKAERFYHQYLEMDVVFRAWRTSDGWEQTTEPVDWDQMMMDGSFPELVYLRRDNMSVILISAGRMNIFDEPVSYRATLSFDPVSLRRIRAKLLMRGYTVVADTPEMFAFRDPYRVIWHLYRADS